MNFPDRARSLLNDEVFQDVVKKQRELYINNILNSADDAIDFRERERLKLRGLEEFLASLQSISDTTEVAKKRFKIF